MNHPLPAQNLAQALAWLNAREEEQALWQEHFPQAGFEDWNHWKWQLAHRLRSPAEIQKILPGLAQAWPEQAGTMPLGLTPYALVLLKHSPTLQKALLPHQMENRLVLGEHADPLSEKAHSPLPNLVHKYPNRALLLTTHDCAVFCRYCTRPRLAGKAQKEVSRQGWEAALQYLAEHKEIREVILSGGDPLVLEDDLLQELLGLLAQIPHLKRLRISSRVPAMLPQRLTPGLARVLGGSALPLFLSLHVLHPDELTPRLQEGLARLRQAGVQLLAQVVLLKGVNDQEQVLVDLMEGLLDLGVRPYALFQADLVPGTAHFRTSIAKGLELMEALRAQCSGLALPHYILDPPGGKVNLAPANLLGQDEKGSWLKNWKGEEVFYPHPPEEA